MKAKTYSVAPDLMIDILGILINRDIPFEVEGVNDFEQTVQLRVQPDAKKFIHRKAVENIESLLKDYRFYRHKHETAD